MTTRKAMWILSGALGVGVAAIGLAIGGCSAAGCGMHGMQPAAGVADSSVKIANVRCPIMGGAVDAGKVNAGLSREYKGQTVAFCCGGCPAQWDNLSEADKDAKLAKVLAPRQ